MAKLGNINSQTEMAIELAYAEITANKTVTATLEPAADLVVAAPAFTADGTTAVVVEIFTCAALPAVATGASIFLLLYLDGVSIGRMALISNPAAGALYTPVHAKRRLTPAAGSRQFSFGAICAGGNGSVTAGPGGVGSQMPAFIRITRAT